MLSVILLVLLGMLSIYVIILKRKVYLYLESSENVFEVRNKESKDKVSGFKSISDTYMKLISEFSFSTEALYMEMKDVLCKIEGMSANAEEQSASVASIESFVGNVNSTVQLFAEHAVQMAEVSDVTHNTVHEKQIEIAETVDKFEVLYNHLQISAGKVKSLEEKTKVAEKLIGSIDSLSDQTNLLALNASIEAARAGDAGRGFAVVATEVRKLSVETSSVVKSITDLLKEIIGIADETREAMNETVDGIQNQSVSLNKAVTDLVEVESATQSMAVENSELAEGTTKLVDSFSDILDMIRDMNIAVEEVALAASEINLSVDSETRMVNQLNESLDELGKNNLEFSQKVDDLLPEQREKTLVVATSPYEPFIIYNPQNGEVSGMDIDLIRSIYKNTDYSVDIKIVPWEMSLEMIKSGVADLLPTISYNRDRAGFIDCSDEYRTESTFAFYTSKSSSFNINTIADLKRKRVGVLQGYSYYKAFDNDSDIYKDISAKEEIMFQKLMKGQIDSVIMNEFSGDYFLKTHGMSNQVYKEDYRHIEKGGAETLMGFSKKQKNKELIKIFNEGFKEKIRNGELKSIEKKYLL